MDKYKEMLNLCEVKIDTLSEDFLNDVPYTSVRLEEKLTTLLALRNYLLDKLEYNGLWEDTKGENK